MVTSSKHVPAAHHLIIHVTRLVTGLCPRRGCRTGSEPVIMGTQGHTENVCPPRSTYTPSTHSLPFLSNHRPVTEPRGWGTLGKEQPFHDRPGQSRVGLTRGCGGKSELFGCDLRESGELSVAGPADSFRRACLHNSDKGRPGDRKLADLQHQLALGTGRMCPGEDSRPVHRLEPRLGWRHGGHRDWPRTQRQRPPGRPRPGGNGRSDDAQEGLFMSTDFLPEAGEGFSGLRKRNWDTNKRT